MSKLHMRAQDLIELYQLTALYKTTYDADLEKFLKMISECYQDISGQDITLASNPRQAGRQPKYTADQNNNIIRLYQSGMSYRQIAKEIGCSIGHIQSVVKKLCSC